MSNNFRLLMSSNIVLSSTEKGWNAISLFSRKSTLRFKIKLMDRIDNLSFFRLKLTYDKNKHLIDYIFTNKNRNFLEKCRERRPVLVAFVHPTMLPTTSRPSPCTCIPKKEVIAHIMMAVLIINSWVCHHLFA